MEKGERRVFPLLNILYIIKPSSALNGELFIRDDSQIPLSSTLVLPLSAKSVGMGCCLAKKNRRNIS